MEKHQGTFSRHDFLQYTILSATGLILPAIASGQDKQEKPAPIKLDIVKEFVGVSHGKFDRCKEMLENDHLLLHVSYDWVVVIMNRALKQRDMSAIEK
jgi:hypothetical protein